MIIYRPLSLYVTEFKLYLMVLKNPDKKNWRGNLIRKVIIVSNIFDKRQKMYVILSLFGFVKTLLK